MVIVESTASLIICNKANTIDPLRTMNMNARHHSRSKIRETNYPVVDHMDKSHSGIECFMRDDTSIVYPFPIGTAHERLVESLNQFLPTSNNVNVKVISTGRYALVLKKSVIDITFRDDAPTILLSTTVHRFSL